MKSEENLGYARVYLENDINIVGQMLVKGSVANISFTSNEGIVERTLYKENVKLKKAIHITTL